MQRWFKVYDFAKHGIEPQRINSARSIVVEGKKLCLTRTEEGYFALEDRCPHAGARLGMGGYCEDAMLICPVHRYRYNVKTGRGTQGDYVQTYPTETREDGVYVAIDKKWWQFY
ncbi:MAG: Rieske 2Fe-2S domain-containing protein [Bacteroidota bacterium]